MFPEIKNFLTNIDIEKIHLFFISRKKRKEEISYSVLRANISEEVRKELHKIICEKLDYIISKNHFNYIEYNPIIRPDDNTIQKISTEHISRFEEITNQFNKIDLDFFDLNESKYIWAYALSFEENNLIIFRKYFEAQNLRKKGIMALMYSNGFFNNIDDNILIIQKEIDCIYYKDEIYILNKDNFEKIFSYYEEWKKKVETDLEKLEKRKIVEDTSTLVEICKTDPAKVRKLHQVLKSNFLNKLDSEIMKKINKDFDLSLEFNQNDKLIINPKNTWKILRLLDDDYLNSLYSHNKYIVHSKEKK